MPGLGLAWLGLAGLEWARAGAKIGFVDCSGLVGAGVPVRLVG